MSNQDTTLEFLSLVENEDNYNNLHNTHENTTMPLFINLLINNIPNDDPIYNTGNNLIENMIKKKEKKINFEFDINNEYYLFSERIKSYKYWPKNYYIQPRELAMAGFFYLGVGDYVKCVCCDVVIYDWVHGANVILEHVKKSKETDDGCEFVRLFLDCDEYNVEQLSDEDKPKKKKKLKSSNA